MASQKREAIVLLRCNQFIFGGGPVATTIFCNFITF